MVLPVLVREKPFLFDQEILVNLVLQQQLIPMEHAHVVETGITMKTLISAQK